MIEDKLRNFLKKVQKFVSLNSVIEIWGRMREIIEKWQGKSTKWVSTMASLPNYCETSLFLFAEAGVTPAGTLTSFQIQIFFYKSDIISSH